MEKETTETDNEEHIEFPELVDHLDFIKQHPECPLIIKVTKGDEVLLFEKDIDLLDFRKNHDLTSSDYTLYLRDYVLNNTIPSMYVVTKARTIGKEKKT